jgi:hypothetical protein
VIKLSIKKTVAKYLLATTMLLYPNLNSNLSSLDSSLLFGRNTKEMKNRKQTIEDMINAEKIMNDTTLNMTHIENQTDSTTNKIKDVVSTNGQTYFILLGGPPLIGHTFEIFSKAVKKYYSQLINAGIDSSNIYALTYATDSCNFLYAQASCDNFDKSFSELEKKITEKDVLFILLETHGVQRTQTELEYIKEHEQSRKNKTHNIEEKDKTISGARIGAKDKETIGSTYLKANIESLKCLYFVVISDLCTPFNFLEDLSKNNGISISSTNPHSHCFGTIFTDYFFEAIVKTNKIDEKIQIDENYDDQITIQELFEYAAHKEELIFKYSKTLYSQNNTTPQLYWQNADPSKLTLIAPKQNLNSDTIHPNNTSPFPTGYLLSSESKSSLFK